MSEQTSPDCGNTAPVGIAHLETENSGKTQRVAARNYRKPIVYPMGLAADAIQGSTRGRSRDSLGGYVFE